MSMENVSSFNKSELLLTNNDSFVSGDYFLGGNDNNNNNNNSDISYNDILNAAILVQSTTQLPFRLESFLNDTRDSIGEQGPLNKKEATLYFDR